MANGNITREVTAAGIKDQELVNKIVFPVKILVRTWENLKGTRPALFQSYDFAAI
jgi:hypothetical protein